MVDLDAALQELREEHRLKEEQEAARLEARQQKAGNLVRSVTQFKEKYSIDVHIERDADRVSIVKRDGAALEVVAFDSDAYEAITMQNGQDRRMGRSVVVVDDRMLSRFVVDWLGPK